MIRISIRRRATPPPTIKIASFVIGGGPCVFVSVCLIADEREREREKREKQSIARGVSLFVFAITSLALKWSHFFTLFFSITKILQKDPFPLIY